MRLSSTDSSDLRATIEILRYLHHVIETEIDLHVDMCNSIVH
jgi:hypothetical protein